MRKKKFKTKLPPEALARGWTKYPIKATYWDQYGPCAIWIYGRNTRRGTVSLKDGHEVRESSISYNLVNDLRSKCPRCGANKNFECRTPKGEKLLKIHEARRVLPTACC